jgi:predicted RNA-binding Zn ribbon-like protein
MIDGQTEEYKFSFVGGELCFDFTNTVGGILTEEPNEHLHTYADLLRWARDASVLNEQEHDRLAAHARAHPAEAESVLHEARDFRRALYEVFSAVAEDRDAPAEAMNALNAMLSRSLTHLTVEQHGDHFGYGWSGTGLELDRVLWPVARSATEVLVDGDLSRVRGCSGHDCGWLFLDTSKNRSRRWCDMSDCGNRAKARRHYRRARADSNNPPTHSHD